MSKIEELFSLASNRDSSFDEFMSKVKELEPLDDDIDVVISLFSYRRYDILEKLQDHPKYGEDAKFEVNVKRSIDEGIAKREKEFEKYPSILKEIGYVLKNATKVGIFDVVYPSRHAIACGLNENYFAVSGDGLFMFMFEVVSLENRGLFKICPNPNLNSGEGRDSIEFRKLGNWEFDDIVNADQIIDVLKKMYYVYPVI